VNVIVLLTTSEEPGGERVIVRSTANDWLLVALPWEFDSVIGPERAADGTKISNVWAVADTT
jgi:hypothetical protein